MKKNVLTQLGEYALFVLPTFACLVVIELIPFINGIAYSLTDWNGISASYDFIGLENYRSALAPGGEYLVHFRTALRFLLTIVPLNNALALILANALCAKRLRSRKFVRALLFMPYVLSSVVVVFLWRFVFNNCFEILGDALGIELLKASWLGEKNLAFWSIVIVSIWSGVGYLTMIYTAGLQTIDESLLEAAVIDGASGLQQFLRVKIPLLMSSVTVCLFLSISGALNMFELPQLMTHGGPAGATTTPALYIYNMAFKMRKYGAGMAQSILLFAFILLVTMIQSSITGRREQQL